MDPIRFPLVIKRRMEVKKVEEVLTKLRASSPSKKDETELMLQMIKWLTYDETRLNQFGHLIHHFKANNLDTSVMVTTFRKTPSLSENEYTLSFYTNSLESNLLNIYHGNQLDEVREKIRKEKEEIQRSFDPANMDRMAYTLEQVNAEFPCHPMNSMYNTRTPKFDHVKLFSLMKF